MPHECTDCGRAFEDGSKEMLSGCPDCGGNTFQFRPDGQSGDGDAATAPDPPEPEVNSTVARTVGNAATAVRDLVGADESPGRLDETTDSAPDPSVSSGDRPPETSGSEPSHITAEQAAHEDAAQASARSEIVSPDDLPERTPSPTREPSVPETAENQREDRPGLDELREQLNEQFESIRVVAPGQYELNLMELYDREEYIIALQEDGKYTIQVPERWSE
ncbi:OapC/ArvC family zinc-ribbon domain-containing protein [Halovenus salina]|uniref:Zn-ribbon containing protein n=1 Tax=Halovenus salina TaxID=1510225 RepID=A0ABD5VZB4_9EURY|nr:Zn-ribbon containing protein [Halovenus salina]